MMLFAVLLLVAATVLGAWAQNAVVGRFRRFGAVPNRAGVSGAEAARAILQANGLEDIGIERAQGTLSDHYDPRAKVLRLSEQVHDGRSVAAIGIAAHEAGHALQEARRYGPLALRNAAVPSARLGSMIGLPLLLLGALVGNPTLAIAGFVFYAGVVLFQLVTLPVELDASRRALGALDGMSLVEGGEERQGVAAVLNAAALTYVAAALSAVALLLYYGLLILGGRRS